MSTAKNVIKKYLQENDCTSSVSILLDRLKEVDEAYETVPVAVIDAYEELSEKEKWEIVGEICSNGILKEKRKAYKDCIYD